MSTLLSVRTNRKTVGMGASVRLLTGEADGDTWRLLDLWTESDQPFLAVVKWSGASGVGSTVKLTVGRGTRVAVYARTVQVDVTNLGDKEATFAVAVADSETFASSANVFQVDGSGNADIPIPPFAVRARLDTDAAYATTYVSVLDGGGVTRLKGTAQELRGEFPVGNASLIRVSSTANQAPTWRVTFLLSL